VVPVVVVKPSGTSSKGTLARYMKTPCHHYTLDGPEINNRKGCMSTRYEYKVTVEHGEYETDFDTISANEYDTTEEDD